MSDVTFSLVEAKARLSELTERASADEEVVITRRGRAIAQIRGLGSERKPVDPALLPALTQGQRGDSAKSPLVSASVVRRMRDNARY